MGTRFLLKKLKYGRREKSMVLGWNWQEECELMVSDIDIDIST
jgi:hypothetical protein